MNNAIAVTFIFVFLSAFLGLILFSLIYSICYFVITSIPYFIMAKKAGFRHPWLAFIPYGQYYVVMTLPRREFNIFNKFITTNRKKAFWAYAIVATLAIVLNVIITILDCVADVLSTLGQNVSSDTAITYLIIMLVCVVIVLLLSTVSLVNTFAAYLIRWRAHYDLLITYGMQEHAMWASIVSLFVPLVIIIFSFIIMNKEPDYGFGNYYVDEDIYLM